MSKENIDRPTGLMHSRAATADTNLTLVAAAAVVGANATPVPLNIHELLICNNTAAAKFIKFYDKATAPVIAADSALIKMRLILPASACLVCSPGSGWGNFLLGIGYVITGAVGDTDATAVAANDVMMNIRYGVVGGL